MKLRKIPQHPMNILWKPHENPMNENPWKSYEHFKHHLLLWQVNRTSLGGPGHCFDAASHHSRQVCCVDTGGLEVGGWWIVYEFTRILWDLRWILYGSYMDFIWILYVVSMFLYGFDGIHVMGFYMLCKIGFHPTLWDLYIYIYILTWKLCKIARWYDGRSREI